MLHSIAMDPWFERTRSKQSLACSPDDGTLKSYVPNLCESESGGPARVVATFVEWPVMFCCGTHVPYDAAHDEIRGPAFRNRQTMKRPGAHLARYICCIRKMSWDTSQQYRFPRVGEVALRAISNPSLRYIYGIPH